MDEPNPTKTPDPVCPDPVGTGRSFLLRRAAIAPLCLCLVAGLHAVRVATCGQTQWKGGGFGMFSTIDSESARFVRAFALTRQGELPLEIPSHLEKSVAETRAAPTQGKLDELAQRLAAIRWRVPDERVVALGRQIASLSADQPVSAAMLARADQLPAILPAPQIGLPRVLAAVPSGQPGAAALPVSSIRIECWTLRLDGTSAALRAVKLGEARAEPTP